jgi:hypothetical protein
MSGKYLQGSQCNNLITMLDRLDSKDWIVVCKALNHVRQLSFFYKEAMLPILGNITTLTVKSLKNLRICSL